MAEEQNGSPLPPKLNLRTKAGADGADPSAGLPPESKAKSETLRIHIPDLDAMAAQVPGISIKPAVPAAEGSPSAGEPGLKRETTRIPLETARAETVPPAQEPGGPKTIRIKPAAPSATIRLTPPPGTLQAEKRKTSRISLEAARPPREGVQPEAPGPAEAPKTVVLKRPDEAATVKAPRPLARPMARDEAKTAMTKTARLDETSQVDADETQASRRKTIKVRRPSQPAAISLAAATQGETRDAEQPRFQEPIFEAVQEDQPHVSFSVLAIMALLVTMVTVYMFMAQTFGPNVSLTNLSYGAPGLDLAWPGKMVVH